MFLITNDEADRENHSHHRITSMHVVSSRQNITSIQRYLDASSKTTAGYRFSMHQIRQHYEYFERKLYTFELVGAIK
jgi:hypothetical protein